MKDNLTKPAHRSKFILGLIERLYGSREILSGSLKPRSYMPGGLRQESLCGAPDLSEEIRLAGALFYFTSTEASHVMVEGHITTMIRPTSMSLQNGKAPQKISVVDTSGGATPLR